MFSSKITPNFYILIFKEHTRHISNDLKIKQKLSSLFPWASNEDCCSMLNLKKIIIGSIPITNYNISAGEVWSCIRQMLRYWQLG